MKTNKRPHYTLPHCSIALTLASRGIPLLALTLPITLCASPVTAIHSVHLSEQKRTEQRKYNPLIKVPLFICIAIVQLLLLAEKRQPQIVCKKLSKNHSGQPATSDAHNPVNLTSWLPLLTTTMNTTTEQKCPTM
jgi:hypothetical protein